MLTLRDPVLPALVLHVALVASGCQADGAKRVAVLEVLPTSELQRIVDEWATWVHGPLVAQPDLQAKP